MEVNKKNVGANSCSGSCRVKGLDGLVKKLNEDFPEYRFREGRKFMFRPPRTIILSRTIFDEKVAKMQLLHELGHALSGHFEYKNDIERVKMEREAWGRAAELAEKYQVEYDPGVAEEELDSYRDWLHMRSTCPDCGSTRYVGEDKQYYCPICDL